MNGFRSAKTCASHIGFLASTTLLAASLSATATRADSLDRRWGPRVEMGGHFGDGRSIGETNLFAPVWQNPDSLLFVDLRGSFDNRSAVEGNFGLGYRHMLDNGWNLGAYGYLDVRRTSLDTTFHQATFGVEALSEYLDLRANAYLPLGNREKRMEIGSWSATSTTGPRAVLTGTSLAIQTQTFTAIGTNYLVERAMAGFDAEVGVRLPVFPDEMKLDFRAFAGGYHFEASGMESISGPRARLELAARDFAGLPGVKLTGGLTWQHDKPRGDQLIASVGLRLPFSAPASREKPLTYMEERMMDAVVRDVDIVTNHRGESQASTTVLTTTEDAINTWNDELVTSVTQIDGAAGQSALQAELDAQGAGAVVIANGAFTGAVATTTVNDGQTLLGGGAILRVRGAVSGDEVNFTAPGAAGSISGSLAGNVPIVRMSDDSALIGMNITHSNGATFGSNPFGIYALGISNAYIIDNSVSAYSNVGTAFGIRLENSSNITVVNNKIFAEHSTANAVALQYVSASGMASGNTLTAHGGTHSYAVFLVDTFGRAPEVLPGSVDNVLVSGSCLLNGPPGSAIGSLHFVDGSSCP
ncbi:inverse autotransporter-like protein with beta domain [Pseudaminobacter salicylatoxidans]|uniref:Inverse autotransporter-like protein with beta domain n=1 Tax=Pseudaminobacter salicylatoxidans TaxID=93369 RepID=A0A316C383_PSESE|nr:inverse autotransporter beta domain-containing protein [Pseudaminobacter salicylatoxidans]PWJ84111.1 inverse autotransporter-like protein with beta domain [Pseudaminobacter salicylatoxidans]